jgi:hypothetical protein
LFRKPIENELRLHLHGGATILVDHLADEISKACREIDAMKFHCVVYAYPDIDTQRSEQRRRMIEVLKRSASELRAIAEEYRYTPPSQSLPPPTR